MNPIELEADRFELRAQQAAEAGEFGAVYLDREGETHSYAALAPAAAAAEEQLELDLPGYSERAMIRQRLADKIEALDAPEQWIRGYPDRLRLARQSGQWGIRLNTGKPVVFWDSKAGLARLCPDDAREESMRVRRRYEPTMRAWVERRKANRLTYAVFTTPNWASGHLREGMRDIFRRFKRIVLESGEFPAIKGTLCVLEAPLGSSRDWNVHLNVILMHDNFVDWGKLRRLWHWNVHMEMLPDAPGAIGYALAELIKYAVAATVAKSARKVENLDSARAASATEASAVAAPTLEPGANVHSTGLASNRAQGEPLPVPPPMLEWRSEELLEWLRAFQGFRRTRAYGALYGLEKPEPEEVGPVAWLGSVSLHGGRYKVRSALLDSIPEDKSGGSGRRSVLEALYRTLAPGGLRGAGAIGDHVPAVTLSAKA